MSDLMQLWDQHPVFPAVVFLFICYLIGRWRKGAVQEAIRVDPSPAPPYTVAPRSNQGDLLSQVLFHWSPYDPFHIGDLLRAVFICGASGSGKTSGSGYFIGKSLVHFGRKVAGIILASKPEDKEYWQEIFRRAGRARDLLMFSAASLLRFNLLDFIQRNGGSTRDIVQAMVVISETLEKNHGGHSAREPFWQQQKERLLYNSVEVLRLAQGRVTAPEIQQIITNAALSPAELATPEWQKKFTGQCLEKAYRNATSAIERHDCQLALDYFLKEYPSMADKTRSGIVAEVLGTLHVHNSGIVRELMSTTTNWTPAVMEDGIWTLIDMPISRDGAAGAFVLGAIKGVTQWYILKRHVREDSPVCVLWADEYQKVANGNGGDASYLAESRSHRGTMVVLTQSIHSLYSRIHEGGEHETDSLLTNFYHKIFHALGDDKTAAYASSLIGRRVKTRVNVSSGGEDNAYDALYGPPKVTASTTQSIENIVENREFMQGLRTGGRAHGYVVDGIVVRSEAFSTGESYLRMSFSQKG